MKKVFQSFPIHYLFRQLIVRKFLPEEIEFCVCTHQRHTLGFISVSIGRESSWYQLPGRQCVKKALRGVMAGKKRTWINSLFNANLHNKKSLFFHDNDWREKEWKKDSFLFRLGRWRENVFVWIDDFLVERSKVLHKRVEEKICKEFLLVNFNLYISFLWNWILNDSCILLLNRIEKGSIDNEQWKKVYSSEKRRQKENRWKHKRKVNEKKFISSVRKEKNKKAGDSLFHLWFEDFSCFNRNKSIFISEKRFSSCRLDGADLTGEIHPSGKRQIKKTASATTGA